MALILLDSNRSGIKPGALHYPGTFATIEEARAYINWYVPWYNQNHKHSGIALFSPDEVHDGTWHHAWARRNAIQQAYYAECRASDYVAGVVSC